MKYLGIFLLSVLCVVGLNNATYAQTPTWANSIGGNSSDVSYVCKVAPNGNVYMAGKFSGTVDLDPGAGVTNVTSNGLEDIFVACYSSTGGFIWGSSIGGASYDAAKNLAIDANNDVVICGYYRGANVDFDPGAGTALMSDAGVTGALTYNGDGFLAKFNSAGVFQWAKSLGGSTVNDVTNDVAIDASFNVYACGLFNASMVVSPTLTWNSTLTGRGYVIKYDAAGTLLWADAFGLTGATANDCAPLSIKVRNGSAYVCGDLQGSADLDPGPAVATQVSVGANDGFVAKYDNAGNYVSSTKISGINEIDIANCLVLGPGNRLYVSGYTNSDAVSFYDAFGSSIYTNSPGTGGNFDFFITLYDTSLNTNVWGRIYGGPGDDVSYNVEVNNNRLYATGYFNGTVDFDDAAATFNMSSAGSSDIFITKYTLDGAFLCGFKSGGTGSDIGYGIALNPVGELYSTGMYTGGPVDFNPGVGFANLTSNGGTDCYLVNYSLIDSSFAGTITGGPVCPGSPGHITFNVTSGFTGPFTIQVSNGALTYTYSGVFSGVPINVTPAPVATTTYSVTSISYPGANLCNLPSLASLGTATMTVSAVTANITSSMLNCNTVAVNSADFGPTYSWAFGDGNLSTSNPVNHSYGSAGSYSVILTVTDTLGCTAKDTVGVSVTAPPAVFIGNDTTFCSTDSLLLHSNIGYPPSATYLWSDFSTGTSIVAHVTGTYWFSVTVGVCTNTDTIHITVNAAPTVNLGNDTAFCLGASTSLQSPLQDPANTYLWNTGSTDSIITVSTTGTYYLTIDNGCKVTDTIHVTVSPLPPINLGTDTVNCQGLSVVLQSSGSFVSPAYMWNDATTGPTLTAATPGTYWLSITDLGCTVTDTITVGIVFDTLILHNNDTAVCKGSIVQGFASANPAATYQWIPTAGVPSSNILNAVITPDTSATYYIYVNMPGCAPVKDSFHIEVQPIPQVSLGGNRGVCLFDTLHIHAAVSPLWYSGYIYNWNPATSLDHSNTADVVYTAGVNQNYIVTVTTSAGCLGQDSAFINVQPGNFATISGEVSLCPGDSTMFTAGGGNTYNWFPSIYLDDSTSATPWVHPVANQSYTMVATSLIGCTDTLKVNVIVYPNAVLFVGDSVMIYPGESYQLDALGNCTTFSWFPAAELNNSLISNPIATPGTDTKYIITAMTADGCVAKDSVSIYVNGESMIQMPNAFVPGSEGNNKFSIKRKGDASLNYFRIYNRWGNLMFETKNIDEGWDGNFKAVPQPFGVYVYEVQAVTLTGKIINRRGNLTLLR